MTWENQDLIEPSSRGFIYLIVNTTNNKLYVGKKKLVTEKRVAVEGRVNRKKVVTPSNWMNYYGSSKELLEDVAKLGKDKFRRIILGAYSELHTVNYGEAEIQFNMRVLDTMNNYQWYNKNITIKAMRPPADRAYQVRLMTVLGSLK